MQYIIPLALLSLITWASNEWRTFWIVIWLVAFSVALWHSCMYNSKE